MKVRQQSVSFRIQTSQGLQKPMATKMMTKITIIIITTTTKATAAIDKAWKWPTGLPVLTIGLQATKMSKILQSNKK